MRHPHIKTILSIGGGVNGSAPFPTIASDGIATSVFARNARQMVDDHGLDGIDSKRLPHLLIRTIF